jgi:single-stranded-DNA-specific exonuclease
MIDEHHAALLFQALPEGVVLHAGGHQAAGGFAVAKDKIHFLEDALNQALTFVDHTADTTQSVEAIELPLACATARHLAVVRRFAPFGVGNSEPMFLFEQVRVVNTKRFGKQKEHIEVMLQDETGSATSFTFFAPDTLIEKLAPGAIVSVLGTLEAGWRGGVRVRIKEIR